MSSTVSPLSYIQSNSSTSGTNSNTNSSTSAASLGGVSANEDTFLTLLVSQLKNQDPLSPTDGTQFVSELAQFSSLEQLITINQNVASVSKVVAPSTAVSASNSSSGSSSSNTSGSGSADSVTNNLNNALTSNLG